jgi:trk system potassium uptake protein TrkA
MRIAIAGAGAVGRAVASELLGNGHKVLLIEQNPDRYRPHTVPEADWLLADACEVSTLEETELQNCDTVIAATGDDKANLAISLLAKSEFGVPRVVARINNAANEWLFTDAWGVDVAVSTPRILAALVEEAVSVGDLVRLFTLRQGQVNLVEVTLPPTTSIAGRPVRDLKLPRDAALVTILRGGRVIVPQPDEPLEPGDELLFVASTEVEGQVREALR